MERYFKITSESRLYKEYYDYEKNNKDVIEHYKDFKKTFGIEASQFIANEDGLAIIPTINDYEKFERSLSKKEYSKARRFKKNSTISKAWAKSIKDKGLKILSKPWLAIYFNTFGEHRTRLFDSNGFVYCSIEFKYSFTETPKGFEEMKASEFFKVIEDMK